LVNIVVTIVADVPMPVASKPINRHRIDVAPPFSRARRRLSDPSLRRLIDQLVAARRRAGLTQEQVATLLGTKKSAISRLEGDFRHRPTLSTIENYALVVRCRVEISIRPWP
jgi:DNA-binding XRE family transcriptional regulator